VISFTESQTVVDVIERVSSVALIIASLELLTYPQTLSDVGLGSWRVHQLANKWVVDPRFQTTIGWFLIYPRVIGLIALRLACAVVFLCGVAGGDVTRATMAIVIAITSMLLTIRSSYGHDGADQMLFLTFASLGLAHALGSPIAQQLALWFITLQVSLSYFTAGFAKLISPIWRSGAALPGILSTEIYGHEKASAFVARYPILAKIGAWSVILFECAFPLSLLGSPLLTITLLSAGAVFHFGTAVFMRLNTFFWAFIATYPAILYCSGILLGK
jgi:hypothetical protein